MATTMHNLNEKYTKRLRQIKALSELISELCGRLEHLTAGERRALFIARRNLSRTFDDFYQTKDALRKMAQARGTDVPGVRR